MTLFEPNDLALLFVASQWPVLLFTFFALAFSTLKLRGRDSSKNLDKVFENFRFGGHRGSPTVKPENTIASMEQARSDGVDLIEFDVSLTKDGVAVILHDDTLDRTTNMHGAIRDFFHRELAACNTAANFMPTSATTFEEDSTLTEKTIMALPTLDEMVDWAKARYMKMIFDVKDTDKILCDKLHELFSRRDLYALGVVCSFHPRVVYRLKQQHPEIPTGLTWRRWQFTTSDEAGTIPRHRSHVRHYLAIVTDIVYAWCVRSTLLPRFLGVDLVLTHRSEISEGYVKLQQRKGLKVCAWTVNDPDEMNWMHRTLHIPFLTDKPHLARRALLSHSPADEGGKPIFVAGS